MGSRPLGRRDKNVESSTRDLQGLLDFVARYRAFRPLIIVEDVFRITVERAGIDFICRQGYLLGGFLL